MESSIAYIPIDRRISILTGEGLADRSWGSALFADISGFTPLTEMLANELGPKRGAEELTRQLDIIYGAVIDQIERYHGTVIGFAGDAITCWFDRDEGLRASASGLAVQQVMKEFAEVKTPSGGTVSLAIKVAIASGPVRRFLVGDPDIQYIDALAGATLDRMAAAEHHAAKGEVVIAGIGDRGSGIGSADIQGPDPRPPTPDPRIEIREWRRSEDGDEAVGVVTGLAVRVEDDPWPVLSDDSFTEAQVRPWILPSVYERISTGQGEYLAEIRPVVALFLRFGGIDYDDDDQAGSKLDAFVRWVQGIVARHEGALLQLIIGDKGSVLYSAFGAPLAHDDDPLRAVAAALELKSPPPELDYIDTVQIGISRGRMRVGPYGSPTRRTYGLLGDDVNVAARLMSRAGQGEVLVSQRITEAISNHFNLRSLGPLNLKGKQQSIMVSQVLDQKTEMPQRLGARDAGLYAAPLVGRDAELARLSELLDSVVGQWSVVSGQWSVVGGRQQTLATDHRPLTTAGGRVLRLEGVAGIGKSHLAAELARQAMDRGVRVAEGACQSTSQGTAYAPWRQVFLDLFLSAEDWGLRTESPETTQSSVLSPQHLERIVAQMNPDWLLRLPLLGDLLGLPIPDNATTAGFDPRLRQSALFDLVVDMVHHWAAESPLLILVDDVQWMDEASQDLMQALARTIASAPVLITVIQRPPFNDQKIIPGLDSLPGYHKLDLSELSPEGIAALVAGRLGGEIDSLALSLVHLLTQGNPFFVQEVVDSLRESGNLIQSAEDWGLRTEPARDTQSPVPSPQSSLWTLDSSVIDTLRQAGSLVRVEGKWELSPGARLSSVDLGLPDSVEGVVLSRIDRLPDAHKLTLRVASVIGRAFALDLLTHAHPLQLGMDAVQEHVDLLETHDFTALEAPPPRPAYIFKHNVTRDVAYETLLFAQRQQLHKAVGDALVGIDPEATEQLAFHTFIGEDWERALRYQTLAGERAQKLFANHEGVDHFTKALTCAENLPLEDTIGERQKIHTNLGIVLTYTGQYEPALAHLNKALAYAIRRRDRGAQAHTCRWIAYLAEYRGELSLALDWIELGLQALGNQENVSTAEMLAIGGLIHTRQGNYDKAQEQCEKSMRIADKLGELTSLAFASNARAIISLMRGNSGSAIEHFQRALELYKQVDNIHGQAMSYNGLANAYFSRGQWPEADDSYRRAREIFDETGDVLHQAFADNNLGGIALNQGRLDDALRYYEESLQSLEQIGGSPYVIGALHMNLGATYIRRLQSKVQSPKSVGAGGGPPVQSSDPATLDSVRAVREPPLRTLDLSEARRQLTTGEDYFSQVNSRDFLPELRRHFATAALVGGDLAEAEDQGQQALELARELTMRGEEGSSLRVLGEIARAQGDNQQAEQHLTESLAVLQEVGDEYEMARTQLSLARLQLDKGDTAQASTLLESCVAVFERLDAALDLAAARELQSMLAGAV